GAMPGGRGATEAGSGVGDREQVVFGRRRIGGSELRGQLEARLARAIGDDRSCEVLGAQAELTVIQRSGSVVSLIDEDADRDRDGGDVKDSEPHGEAKLQRAKMVKTHPFVSTSR